MPVKFGFGNGENAINETWIRGLKEGEIRVRFLDEYSLDPNRGWMQFQEHYVPEVRSYVPCSPPECVGCASDNEKARKKSRKFLVNLLDEEGVVRLYKLPFKSVKVQADNWYMKYKTLCDRDYTINRMGSGLDSVYQLIPTNNIFPLEKHYEKHNPIEIAQAAHDRAAARLYGPPSVTIGAPVELVLKSNEEILVPEPSTIQKSGTPPTEWYEQDSKNNSVTSTTPSKFDLSVATKEELVSYLEDRGVEVSATDHRSTLIKKFRGLHS